MEPRARGQASSHTTGRDADRCTGATRDHAAARRHILVATCQAVAQASARRRIA
jgi:hypothetical protein